MTDDDVKQAYSETHSPYVPPVTLVATHWIPRGLEFEDSPEFPLADPIEAARVFLQLPEEEGGNNDDVRNDLMSEWSVTVTLSGCIETTDLLMEGDRFDGYEPGCKYWKRTGEKRVVKLTITSTLES